MGKIGIMGGTFNPIHMGHLLLAQYALEENALDEIWLIPTGCSYMKRADNEVSAEERYHMTKLAVSENPKMRCMDIEIKREGYTYTYETLEQLRSCYPQHELYFIFGADCLFSIEKWKYPQKIFENCTIIAAVRSGTSIEKMEQKKAWLEEIFHAKIILMPFLQLELSSTAIRQRVKEKKSIRYMVPDAVLHYIEEKEFYRQG
ncbi:MAG: nicotinate-nucleotide adenylyltransferase [Acetatifactor sp.]